MQENYDKDTLSKVFIQLQSTILCNQNSMYSQNL